MRLAPVENKPEKQHIFLQPYFIITFVVVVLSSVCVFLLTRQKEEAVPTMLDIVAETTAAAAAHKHYNLVIEESGPGYLLRFSGQVHDDRLYGKIDGYDLEIFADEDQFFIKNSLASEWQDIKTAKLETLPTLIRDPHYLLANLMAGKEIAIETGTPRTVDDVICQTYFLEIPPPNLQLLTRFSTDATLDKLQVYLWFAEESGFMHRLAVMMNVTVAEETIQINRTYNLSPEAKDFPEDIPKINRKVMPI
ncbi:MAG TPA: hypothetical protein VFC74_08960 [Oscillospiraceae bacterium]|nr:hypothetical protein [Oscillospiraceae bacterium]